MKLLLRGRAPPLMRSTPRFLARCALAVLLLFCWWTLSLPLYVDVPVALAIVAAAALVPVPNLALLALSLLVVLAGLEITLRVAGESVPLYYREHERFARPEEVYQAHVDEEIAQPHGDLATLDPLFPRSAWEPRSVRFRTDGLGYRNAADYQPGADVLVGDSFVVANGTSEPDTLAEVLRAEGVAAYALAYPSNFIDYERRALWFISTVDPQAVISLFVFEGNDFTSTIPPRPSGARRMPSAVANLLDAYDGVRADWTPLALLRYPVTGFSLARRLERRWIERQPSTVFLVPIGSQPVGFLELWARAAFEPRPGLVRDDNDVVRRHTACVFFIPEKLRTYARLVPAAIVEGMIDPPPGLRLLETIYGPYGIPVVDLTGPLQQAAAALLAEGRFVFWRDDTHWNGAGIRAVAGAVRDCLVANRARVLAQLRQVYRCDVPQPSAGAAGAVERVTPRLGTFVLRGWAADETTRLPADRLLACVGAEVVSSARPRIVRPDVGRKLRGDPRAYGFELPVPRQALRHPEALRIYAAMPDGRFAQLPLNETARAAAAAASE
jgi:hypothetical protein